MNDLSRRRLLGIVGGAVVAGTARPVTTLLFPRTVLPHRPLGPLPPASGWKTTFADDFAAPRLDRRKWFPGLGATYSGTSNTQGANASGWDGKPSGEYQLYTPHNVTVSHSTAALTMRAQTIVGQPNNTRYEYTGGCISSYPLGGTAPGYKFTSAARTVVSASVQIPPAFAGSWPAFWCTGPLNGWNYEVDVFEFYSSSVNPQQNIHYVAGTAPNCNAQAGPYFGYWSTRSFASGFHTYTADINADGQGRTDYYIDGFHLISLRGQVEATELYVVLNFALYSSTPPKTALPAAMLIDWVAVYQPA